MNFIILRDKVKNLVIVADKGAYKQAVELSLEFTRVKNVYVVSFENASGKDINEVGLQEFMMMYESTPQMTYALAMEILTLLRKS